MLFNKVKKKLIRLKYFLLFLLNLRYDFDDKRIFVKIGSFLLLKNRIDFKTLFKRYYLIRSRNILNYMREIKRIYRTMDFNLNVKDVCIMLDFINSNKLNTYIYCSNRWIFTYNRRLNKIFVSYLNTEYPARIDRLFIQLPDEFKDKDIEELMDFMEKLIRCNYEHFDKLLSQNKKNNKNIDFNELVLRFL
jgi:hypothetical protein